MGQQDTPPGVRRGVLFDVDGTLIDSSYLHTISWWGAFRQYGYDIPMASIHYLVGMGGDRLVDSLLPSGRDRSLDEVIMASHGALYAAHWPALRAFDGSKDLLAQCHAGGLAVALASSAREKDLQIMKGILNADAFIDAATSSKDAEESKPAPDILAAALKAIGVEPANAIFVGDAVWDMKAAAALGIPAVGVTCGGISADVLRDAGAVEVYEGPADLVQNLAGSAIGKLLNRVS
ncbi:HAD-superfamily hydrolase, subfamily IA, variant 3 [Pseudarthrobacter chlorophenolicus A6]|uniref:HAD-superfamily hydrolase, subfamily IA, variant 3 n=1 Tax=Pseudarthrobacter chlorophenolicus (strain ATCC 700700 / DSM 12829 / CIP 107037 / JCM 12360 / KCTC 9906 / NCIMB 13794 / A6) TaxID=452863 RepID=B8HFY6_PSECP|nr:HAD family hydrolase [Pseudarthrobacter chlorophenolicus]ACL41179.1 HAD-superfamily hydrolase, subfamily IA, variant 3 [Pseudarthrobacter chlorophenolicus A6]SDQ68690.1 haloacid dehalogenase superfamily, subfamily IA, variant 3 with third motif having DD or ED/haloacid dehalogenase superfamily, subfamily IA, variant 1 with third motif having Dx(3-4)D or Dx(3-4)E [Pseudarthrobacter chlorophenolicus]